MFCEKLSKNIQWLPLMRSGDIVAIWSVEICAYQNVGIVVEDCGQCDHNGKSLYNH